MRPFCVVAISVLLVACGEPRRRTDSAAAISGWTSGEEDDTRPRSHVLGDEQASEPAAPRSRTLGTPASPVTRRGSRVDVRFRDAEVREAMRLLAEVAGLDVVVDEAVHGTVTVDLRDVTPLDAMVAIAEANGALVEQSGRTVLVRAR